MTSEARRATAAADPGQRPRRVPDVRLGGRRIELRPHACFACGDLNAHGLHLQLHAAGDRCWTELRLPDRFAGWEGIAHGGITCTILDEVMAWALIEHDVWGVTARMSVAFRRPVRIGAPIRAEGWVTRSRRRLFDTAGHVVDLASGEELATAEATYAPASPERREALKARYGFRLVDDGLPETVDVPGAEPR